ncbi:hypothetical protein ACHAWX_001105 [Stephanocyclus meneghinianus]
MQTMVVFQSHLSKMTANILARYLHFVA